jgi:Tfp pilus assembly protein PilO
MAKEVPVKIENRQRSLIIATIVLLAAFAADKLAFGPLARAWKARADRIADLRREVADGSLLLQRESNLQARWDQMRTNTLPNNTSLAEQQLLKAVDAWSRDSRVSVTGITPQWKQEADDYMTLECRVDASGDLSALSRFLYDIEKSPMALQLQLVELTARDDTGQELAMGLQISGLVLTPGGQQP